MGQFSVFFGRFFSLEPIGNLLRNGRKDRAQLSRLAFEIGRRFESIKLGKPELLEAHSGFAGFAKRQFDLVQEVSAASGFVCFGQIVGYGVGGSYKLPPNSLTWDARKPARTRNVDAGAKGQRPTLQGERPRPRGTWNRHAAFRANAMPVVSPSKLCGWPEARRINFVTGEPRMDQKLPTHNLSNSTLNFEL